MRNIIILCLICACANAVEFNEGKNKIKVGGQVVADTARIDDNGLSNNDSELRRVRLYLKGDINKNFAYEVEYSFIGNNNWKDLYIKYTGFKNWVVYGGNIKEPFGLEALTSSKYNTFMERGLADFYSSRKLGLFAQGYHKNDDNVVTYSLGGFMNSIDDILNDEKDTSSFVGRVTYAKMISKKDIFHVGLALSRTNYDLDKIKLSSNAGSKLYDGSFIKTKIKNVDSTTRVGLEVATVLGSFSFQSEYISISLSKTDIDYKFNGWYTQLSYFLTGESRNYKAKTARFSRVKPIKPMDKDGFGAIEVACRVTQIDLEDKDKKGGKERDYTLGINWYLKSNLRLMADYTYAKKIEGKSKDANIFQLRAQYDF